ncbi:hypothetical protein [Paracoccus salipaludis]|uniref:hypothetical protein n=1 Tax=Paracoccus salipaludis TaxID=2032623 RepID=UPI0019803D70|nr:hypothetical protein [Paracoccus salipaludis]
MAAARRSGTIDDPTSAARPFKQPFRHVAPAWPLGSRSVRAQQQGSAAGLRRQTVDLFQTLTSFMSAIIPPLCVRREG